MRSVAGYGGPVCQVQQIIVYAVLLDLMTNKMFGRHKYPL